MNRVKHAACVACLALAASVLPAQAGSVSVSLKSGVSGFLLWVDEMNTLDSARWELATWSNGGMFANSWSASQASVGGGLATLTVESTEEGLVGGEMRTHERFPSGTFEARLKASDVPGTVAAMFLYTGPSDGTAHFEIDVELISDRPTKLWTNYFYEGAEHPLEVDLGFDASAGFHDYRISWTAERITWLVDGITVREVLASDGAAIPAMPMKLMLNHWASTGTEPWSSDYDTTANPRSVMAIERVAHW